MSQEREKEFESVEAVLENLPDKEYKQVWRILYGDGIERLYLNEKSIKLAMRYKLEVVSCKFKDCKQEQIRPPRIVKVGLFQQKCPVPLSFPIRKVKTEMYTSAMDAIKVAAKAGVKIFCLQQAWNMPYAFCEGEKMPWCEYAENAEDGPTTRILAALAEENKMVIVSTILERDNIFEDKIWNTAVVIDNYGYVLGKHRANHISKAELPNEPTYYCEGNTGHPVFKTDFGKIGVNISFGRHSPLNWLGFALNGAEIVFNPCAVTNGDFEPIWRIEGRNAAIANGYFVCSINRLGMEIYEHEYEKEDGEIVIHKDSGQFFGSSYISAPNGTRTPSLSRVRNALLITELDLNMCRQIKDQKGFEVLQHLEPYISSLKQITKREVENTNGHKINI